MLITLLKRPEQRNLVSSQQKWDFPGWPGEDAPSSTRSSNTTSASGLLNDERLRNNSHSINVARHDAEDADPEESRRKWKYPPLPGDRDYVLEHHSTQGARKRRRTKKIPSDQDLEQSTASSSTEDGNTRSQKDQPLCISKFKVAKTNQSEPFAGRAQKRTTSESSKSDRDLEDKLASRRDVKVPCPHPNCATETVLYQSGRFTKKEESALIDHQRKVHDFSKFPCTFEGCPKRGGKGYYRQGNLEKHEKKEHGLYAPVKKYSDSEDKLASRRDVKVPCPHPNCATETVLYQSGRFTKMEESALIDHQRKVHDFSKFPCTFEGCPKRGGKGYYRQGNLEKHEKKEHGLHLIDKILRNESLDLYSQSEDELA